MLRSKAVPAPAVHWRTALDTSSEVTTVAGSVRWARFHSAQTVVTNRRAARAAAGSGSSARSRLTTGHSRWLATRVQLDQLQDRQHRGHKTLRANDTDAAAGGFGGVVRRDQSPSARS